MMNGYGYGMDGFGGLGMLIFWGLVIFGIVLLVRWLMDESRHGSATLSGRVSEAPGQGHDNALKIARERLAKGEITPEEYESIKLSLEK